MKMKMLLTAAAASLLLAAIAFGQSLADIARKEKERRAAIKGEVQEINNTNKDQHMNGPVTIFSPAPANAAASEPAKEAGAEAKKEPAAAAGAADEPVDFSGRPESFWRQTMADARKRVSDLEDEQRVLTLRLADLQNKFYAEASGFSQQDIQREIQKTYYEQDQNKKSLEEARKALADLHTEGRKDGALPGWLEPGTR